MIQSILWTNRTSDPRTARLSWTARLRASMAVAIEVTVTMPMMMPNVVRTDRILLARMASQAMSNPSLISSRKFTAASSFVGRVLGDQAVANADDASGVAGDIFLVGDDKNGVSFLGEQAHQNHDFIARLGVQVA